MGYLCIVVSSFHSFHIGKGGCEFPRSDHAVLLSWMPAERQRSTNVAEKRSKFTIIMEVARARKAQLESSAQEDTKADVATRDSASGCAPSHQLDILSSGSDLDLIQDVNAIVTTPVPASNHNTGVLRVSYKNVCIS